MDAILYARVRKECEDRTLECEIVRMRECEE